MTWDSLLSCNLSRELQVRHPDIAGLAKSAFGLWNPPCSTCLFQCNFTNLHFIHQVVECQVHCDFQDFLPFAAISCNFECGHRVSDAEAALGFSAAELILCTAATAVSWTSENGKNDVNKLK